MHTDNPHRINFKKPGGGRRTPGLKRCEIKWVANAPGFDRLESVGHNELTAKHCYFRFSRPPDVDGINIFDKDDQAAKHCLLSYCFVAWSSLSKILIPSTSGGLEHLK